MLVSTKPAAAQGMSVKQLIKRVTRGSFLYSPLRDAYQLVCNRGEFQHRKEMTSFYRQFVPDKGLVFDVGANVGLYTEIFLKLGARVVAIEPNLDCAEILEKVRPRNRVVLERVAVGSKESELPLFLCDDSSAHSTMSREWIGVAKDLPRLAEKKWTRTVNVRTTTLDYLMAKHGCPNFLKIDVEGFELEALKGLSKLAPFLSFEFISEMLDAAIQCIELLRGSKPNIQFNILINQPQLRYPELKFALKGWVSADKIINVLNTQGIKQAATYGEIFVRTG
jgi:FkbM family methyltransferase